MDVEWTSNEGAVPVHLAHFRFARHDDSVDCHLFGARYSLAEAVVGGDSVGSGYFIEYVVAEQSESAWTLHRLVQRASVTYSEREEQADYIPATDIRNPAELSVQQPPVWKAEDAIWPKCAGMPMTFLGQINLPETEMTRELLTWGLDVYLFVGMTDGLHFKVVEQDVTEQTAEEHYEEEDGS